MLVLSSMDVVTSLLVIETVLVISVPADSPSATLAGKSTITISPTSIPRPVTSAGGEPPGVPALAGDTVTGPMKFNPAGSISEITPLVIAALPVFAIWTVKVITCPG
jgi:hypothetical protein